MRKTFLLLVPLAVLAISSCSPRSPVVKAFASPAVIAEQLRTAGFDVPAKEVMSEDFTLEALSGGKVSLSSFKGKVVLLSFWATWCGPCKQIAPSVDALATRYAGRLKVGKIDVDRNRATVGHWDIRGYPTLLLFKDGVVVGRLRGAVGKNEIAQMIDSNL
jgi:thioredoxin 1